MRKLMLTITALCFSLSLYVSASAATLMSDKDSANALMEADQQSIELQLQTIDEKQESIENDKELTDDQKQSKLKELDDERKKAINSIGAMGEIYLTEGFEALYTSQFEDTKLLAIEAPEGTMIQVIIIDDNNNILYLEEPITVGASGMYDTTLQLKSNDENLLVEGETASLNNIVCIFIKYNNQDYARRFEVNKKLIRTKNELEAYDVNSIFRESIEQSDDQGDSDETTEE